MRTMCIALAALLTALAAEGAVAQDETPESEPPAERRLELDPVPQEDGRRVRYAPPLNASPYSFLSTEVNLGFAMQVANGTAANGFGNYGELFGDGTGFELSGRLRMVTKRGYESSFSLGPVLRLSHQTFGGSTAIAGNGDRLTADNLAISAMMLGFHLTPQFGEFYFGPAISVGPSIMSSVDATVYPVTSQPRSGELYRTKIDFAFDIRLRAGWAVEFDGGHRLGFEVFMGYATLGRPEANDDPGALVPGASPGTLNGGRFGLLVSFEMRRLRKKAPALDGED